MADHRQDRTLAIVGLVLLALGCLLVLRHFLSSILWAAILGTTSWPAFVWLNRLTGQRRVLAASLMTTLVTAGLLVPVIVATVAMADNVAELARAGSDMLEQGLPDPPQWLAGLPLLGESLHNYWMQFSHDGRRLVEELAKFSQPARAAALSGGRVLGQGVIDIALSVFLAFFFYVHGEMLATRLQIALGRIAGSQAAHLLSIARGTLTGVIYGILGTALAQGVLAALGFAIASVPGAMLLGVATFFLSLIPVGPPLVWGGAAIWLFQQGRPGWAVFVAAWGFFIVSTVDNVIKPVIISRGAQLPFAIVFLGVLGGVLAFGVIGAFLGPTLLAVGYRIAGEWTSLGDGKDP